MNERQLIRILDSLYDIEDEIGNTDLEVFEVIKSAEQQLHLIFKQRVERNNAKFLQEMGVLDGSL